MCDKLLRKSESIDSKSMAGLK